MCRPLLDEKISAWASGMVMEIADKTIFGCAIFTKKDLGLEVEMIAPSQIVNILCMFRVISES